MGTLPSWGDTAKANYVLPCGIPNRSLFWSLEESGFRIMGSKRFVVCKCMYSTGQKYWATKLYVGNNSVNICTFIK